MVHMTTGTFISSSVRIYGIANCDTVKKARTWLTTQGLSHDFHDFKKLGVPAEALRQWQHTVGWECLLNRQSATWRKLTPEIRASVQDATSAAQLLLTHPSAIKRPVVQWPDGRITVGFKPDEWVAMLHH